MMRFEKRFPFVTDGGEPSNVVVGCEIFEVPSQYRGLKEEVEYHPYIRISTRLSPEPDYCSPDAPETLPEPVRPFFNSEFLRGAVNVARRAAGEEFPCRTDDMGCDVRGVTITVSERGRPFVSADRIDALQPRLEEAFAGLRDAETLEQAQEWVDASLDATVADLFQRKGILPRPTDGKPGASDGRGR